MNFKLLNEAFFEGEMDVAMDKVESYLETHTGTSLLRLPFNRISNKGMNVIYVSEQDERGIKFNFEIEKTGMKYKKKTSYGCTSIDIYGRSSQGKINRIDSPDITINIPAGLSFVKILPTIASFFIKQMPKKYVIYRLAFDDKTEILIESKPIKYMDQSFKTQKEFYQHLKSRRLPNKEIQNILNTAYSGQDVMTTVGKLEGKVGTPDIEDAPVALSQVQEMKLLFDKLMDEINYTSPSEVFFNLQKRIDNLIDSRSPVKSLVVTGMGGIGKTYTITNYLKDKDIYYATGADIPSVSALFRLLYVNNYPEKILLFDDCDTLVKQQPLQNMLKLSLDTSDSPLSYFASKGFYTVAVDPTASSWENNQDINRNFLLQNAEILKFVREDADAEEEEDEDVVTESVFVEKKEKRRPRSEVLIDALINPKFAELWNSKAPLDLMKLINEIGVDISQLKFPSKFFYSGKMIFISNMDESAWPAPLSSRAFKINIELNPFEVLELIEEILPNIEPQYSMEVKSRALKVFRKDIKSIDAFFKIKFPKKEAYFNLRSFIKALSIAADPTIDDALMRKHILCFCLC